MKELSGRSIFMTGGTGFFGKSLLDWLLEREIFPEIITVCRAPDEFLGRYPRFKRPEWRFLPSGLPDAAPDIAGNFDYVIHAASTLSYAPDVESFAVESARHMIEFAAAHNAKTLFMSSGAVYGVMSEKVEEEQPLHPVSPYGRGKMRAEELYAESGLPTVAVRAFTLTGNHQDLNREYATSNFIKAALNGDPLVITGSGDTVRSYLHADEWVEWSLQLMLHGAGVYNVGSEESITIRELAELVNEFFDGKPGIIDRGEGAGSFYLPNIGKIRRDFGLAPRYSGVEALKKVIDYHKGVKSK